MPYVDLRTISRPVLLLMEASGHFKPAFKPMNMVHWILTAGFVVSLTLFATAELAISAMAKLGSALEIITILLTLLEMCFRISYFAFTRTHLERLFDSCEKFPVTSPCFLQSESTMRERVKLRFRRTFVHFTGYIFMVLIGYLSLPFLPHGPEIGLTASSDITASIVNPARKRPLYIPMWLPVDVESLPSPNYECLVVWQAWCFVVLVCMFCAADCLMYSFVIFIVEGLRHLKRIPLYSASDLQADKTYRIWIQQHQFLLRLSREVNDYFSPIIFATFLTNGVLLCVLAYVLIKLRSLVGILCVTGHFSCIVVKLYVMASFGQQFRDENVHIPVECLTKMLPNHRARRTDVRLISLTCQNPICLTGFGFFDLSVEFFGRVCSVALSYFILLLQVY